MDRLKAKFLAKELNELACKGCTEGWLEKHDGLTDPIKDIIDCDEAFVTGTFAGIIPVSKLEERELKSTSPDSLVNKIRILYNKEILNYIG